MWRLLSKQWLNIAAFGIGVVLLIAFNVGISETTIDISQMAIASTNPGTPKELGVEGFPQSLYDLELPETLTRPLFSPTRREFFEPPEIAEEPKEVEPASEPLPVVSMNPPPIKLSGIRILGGNRSALIGYNKAAGSDAVWVNEGDTVEGWNISLIRSDRISLTAGSQTIVIALYE
ncbi:hypothetical protein [Agrobacterium sp. 22117]|uniref:hypothetical protein n=1 Tax=Agrobacterium sp. 22117 TaxID=3453880 RepID=UPI003F861E98